jgi:hypothetical protein
LKTGVPLDTMKIPSHETNVVHMPPEVLAEARQAAS